MVRIQVVPISMSAKSPFHQLPAKSGFWETSSPMGGFGIEVSRAPDFRDVLLDLCR
jgi:hypothetical protein